MAWLAGFYLPRLDYSGKWSLRTEYEHIGEFPYHHGQYVSGWTTNKLFLGNTVGPDSNKVTTILGYYFTPDAKIEGNFSFIHRSSNQYITTGTATDITDIAKTFDGPEEYHALNIYTLEVPILNTKTLKHQNTRILSLRTSLGLDYVINKNFIQGNKKADFMAEIGLVMYFGR